MAPIKPVVPYITFAPKQWDTPQTKYCFDIKLGKMIQNDPDSELDEHVPYLKAVNVNWLKVDQETDNRMWASPSQIQNFGIRPGDLLISEGGDVGRSGMVESVPEKCIIQNALHRVRSKSNSYNRFLYYYMSHIHSSGWLDILCNKATIAHLTLEKLGSLHLSLPPLKTQKQIADFLDKETTRIDTLISRKQKQIELLQEKRQAIITQSVTRGLSASASRAEGNPDLPAPRPKAGTFCIYVLKCSDASFYIGQSNDFPRRLREHEKGKISRTSKHLPVEPIHWEEFDSQEEAIKREKELKTGFGRKWLKEQYKKNAATSRQTSVKMKDSNVEWIGKIPEHWEIRRFRHVFKIKKRISGKSGLDVLSITQKGIKVKDIESGDGQLSMDYSKYQYLFQGEYAMNQMDLLTGFVDISMYDGVTSPDYRVFSLIDVDNDSRFFLYYLQTGYIEKWFFPFGQGAAQLGRWRLPRESFNNFACPIPPIFEQKKISRYIDKETEKIDRLTEKIFDSITLLKEYRSALITHAVSGQSLPPSVYGRQAAAGQPDTSKPACTSQADSCEFSG